MRVAWVYPLKKKILIFLFGFLALFVIAILVFLMLKKNLINDIQIKTQELNHTIGLGMRSLMIMRNPSLTQEVLENLKRNTNSIVRVAILNKDGKVKYSSDKDELEKVLDKYHDPSCRGCHQKIETAPSESTLIFKSEGMEVYRNVKTVYNEEACYQCHSKSDRIIGKIIIDRSLESTYSLITSIELVIFGSGIACLVFLIPFLSKSVNRLIIEIFRQNEELSLLYQIVENLSKTIDLGEVNHIVIDIVRDTLKADEVDIVHPKEEKRYGCIAWTRRENKILRKKIDQHDPLAGIINSWLEGKFDKEKTSEDGKQVYMPIIKGDTQLALIVVRKGDGVLDPLGLSLIRAMCGHIAVAFENAQLYRIAITDELTHLYTPRHFRYCMEKKFSDFEKHGEKLTLLMLDIDDFKKINDTCGHLTGDSVLKGVARGIIDSLETMTILLSDTGARSFRSFSHRPV